MGAIVWRGARAATTRAFEQGKDRNLGISKQDDAYLRRLLVIGAAVLRHSRKQSATNS